MLKKRLKKSIILRPLLDYYLTRKKLYIKFVVPLIISIFCISYFLFFNVNTGVDIKKILNDFIYGQVSAISILISFSLAIITILVSSNSDNVNILKEDDETQTNYKLLNGEPLTLFQVMLSNITYNVLIEIFYLIILIIEIFIQLIIPVNVIKFIITLNIFILSHILLTLLESISFMYLSFWNNKKPVKK